MRDDIVDELSSLDPIAQWIDSGTLDEAGCDNNIFRILSRAVHMLYDDWTTYRPMYLYY